MSTIGENMEYFDIYDENRAMIGKTCPRSQKLSPGEHRVVVHLCIFNSKGELLIQQRQDSKGSWGGLWDISLGGGVQAGESSRGAVERELKEELGLIHDFTGIRPLFTFNFKGGFDDFYFIEKNVDISKLTLQADEVKGAKWASKDEVLRLYDSNKFIPFYRSLLEAIFELRQGGGALDMSRDRYN